MIRMISESDDHLLLTAAQAAELCNVSERSWRSWDSAAKIPAGIKLGRAKRWRPGELRAWVQAGCPPRREWNEILDNVGT